MGDRTRLSLYFAFFTSHFALPTSILRAAAIAGIAEIPGEFWDLDEAEQSELVAITADKLGDFGLNEAEVLEATELILAAAVADAQVARFFIAHKKPGE